MKLNREHVLTLTCLKEVGVKGVGPRKIFAIGSVVENGHADVTSYESLYEVMSGIKDKAITQVTLEDLAEANKVARRIIDASEQAGIGLVCYYDDEFPDVLRKTVNEDGKLDPPLLLWYRGDLSIAQFPGIAVIGTREATKTGLAGGEFLAGEFAKRGFNIVSGLAIGCDTSGHNGALNAGGKTTAILANGLDTKSIYPEENQDLAERIVESGGLLLSECYIGTSVNRYSLVARDRLQAGLSLATLVVQTGVTGGTMHAVNATLQADKPLYTMWYKDSSTNQHDKCKGNAMLVREKGAKYIKGDDNLDDICSEIKTWEPQKTNLFE